MNLSGVVDGHAPCNTAQKANQGPSRAKACAVSLQTVQHGSADEQAYGGEQQRNASQKVTVVLSDISLKITVLFDGGWLAWLTVRSSKEGFDIFIAQAHIMQLPILPAHTGDNEGTQEKQNGQIFGALLIWAYLQVGCLNHALASVSKCASMAFRRSPGMGVVSIVSMLTHTVVCVDDQTSCSFWL